MSKKKVLLEEGSVRQFMKLANLNPLAEEFVADLYEAEEEVNEDKEEVVEEDKEEVVEEAAEEEVSEDKEEASEDKEEIVEEGGDDSATTEVNLEEGLGTALATGAASKLGSMAMDAVSGDDDEEVTEELGEEMPEEMPEEGGDELDVTSLVQAIANAITSETGVEVDVAGAAEEAPPEEEMGEPEEMDVAAPEEMPMPEPEDEAPANRYEENIDDEAISAIAERVMKKISKEKKKEDVAAQVAERVMNRISNLNK